MTDVVVIGAGPAGLSAALELQGHGLLVTVVDDQPAPGGRIFAAIENRSAHGAEDRRGAALVADFRAAGGSYLPAAEVWQLEAGPRVFLTQAGRASMLEPRFVILATGAQERPMPFPGWQLPGVMTVGSAQILLKTARQIPDHPVWLAGTGPLLLLYVQQLLAAGGSVAGILDTTRARTLSGAAKFLPGALAYGWRDLLRGASWLAKARKIPVVRGVTALAASGGDRLASVRYETRTGDSGTVATNLLLVHDGVVPAVHASMAAGVEHHWNTQQNCFEPILGEFGASSNPNVYIAGDGASILGAAAAMISGRIAGIGVARAAGRLSEGAAQSAVALIAARLDASRRFRRLIDTLYPPTELALPDDAILCRCEEVTAGQVRAVLHNRSHAGPDGVKIATRVGMGPCQGRQCALTLTRLAAEVTGRTPSAVGFLRIRPPLKPLTVGELATLETA